VVVAQDRLISTTSGRLGFGVNVDETYHGHNSLI